MCKYLYFILSLVTALAFASCGSKSSSEKSKSEESYSYEEEPKYSNVEKKIESDGFTWYIFFDNGQVGALNVDKEIIIEAKYENIYYSNGYFLVERMLGKKHNHYYSCGIYDNKGNIIISTSRKYTHILFKKIPGTEKSYFDVYVWYKGKARHGVCDINGNNIVPAIYDNELSYIGNPSKAPKPSPKTGRIRPYQSEMFVGEIGGVETYTMVYLDENNEGKSYGDISQTIHCKMKKREYLELDDYIGLPSNIDGTLIFLSDDDGCFFNGIKYNYIETDGENSTYMTPDKEYSLITKGLFFDEIVLFNGLKCTYNITEEVSERVHEKRKEIQKGIDKMFSLLNTDDSTEYDNLYYGDIIRNTTTNSNTSNYSSLNGQMISIPIPTPQHNTGNKSIVSDYTDSYDNVSSPSRGIACRACMYTNGKCPVCRGYTQLNSTAYGHDVIKSCRNCGGSGNCPLCGGDGWQ